MFTLHPHHLHEPIRVILDNNYFLENLGNIIAILFTGFVIWYSMKTHKSTKEFNEKNFIESKRNNMATLAEIENNNRLTLRPILDTRLEEIRYKEYRGWRLNYSIVD